MFYDYIILYLLFCLQRCDIDLNLLLKKKLTVRTSYTVIYMVSEILKRII